MSFLRTLLIQFTACAAAASLCACAFQLTPAKPDLYVTNKRKVRKVLVEVFGVKDSRIEGASSLASLGMVPGKNDEALKQALEKEFNIAIPLAVIDRNPDVENLVAFFSDDQNILIVPKEKFQDFGPISPEQPKSKSEKPDAEKTKSKDQ